MTRTRKLSIREKISYSLGLIPDTYSTQNVNLLAMVVYNVVLGIDPAVVGAILALSRISDAFFDTGIGNYIDKTTLFGGRRKPFIIVGAISTALAIQLIWLAPSNMSQTAIAIYFAVCLNIFYVCYSIYSVSYESLGMDLTDDYDERSQIFSIRELLRQPLSLGIPWMTAAIYWDVFDSPLMGARVVGLVVGLIVIIFGIYTGIYTRERKKSSISTSNNIGLFRSLYLLRNNKPFLTISSMAFFSLFAIFLYVSLGFYVTTYYLFEGDLQAGAILGGYAGTLSIAGSSVGALIGYHLSKRIDRVVLVRFSSFILMFTGLATWMTFTPDNPYLSLITHPFSGAATVLFWVGLMSMRADVCDWDECLFRERRTGLITGAMSWMAKLGLSLGLLLGGVFLSYIGFDAATYSTSQSNMTTNLKLFFVIAPSALYAVIFMLSMSYKLDKQKHRRISTVLQIRHAVSA